MDSYVFFARLLLALLSMFIARHYVPRFSIFLFTVRRSFIAPLFSSMFLLLVSTYRRSLLLIIR